MTITNPLPPTKKLSPFRRWTEQGIKVRVQRHIGKVALGVMPAVLHGREEPIYCGRWRNRYTKGFTMEAVLTQLRRFRAEHRAHEQALISFSDARDQLLLPPGALRLFALTFGLIASRSYERRELRRLILSRRGKFTACQLRCLNQIQIEEPRTY